MRPECRHAAAPYTLVLPQQPIGGRAGERLGRGAGSSVEFMDFRDYQPGDDLRHVDWRAFARTDQLKVRLYREEIAPVLDLVVDTSPSMAVTGDKARAVQDLCDAAVEWIRRAAGTARVAAAGGDRLDPQSPLRFDGAPAGNASIDVPRVPLRPRSLRMLLSDFLFEGDPEPAIRRLAAGASHLWVLQVLDAWELEPAADGARTLVDSEDGVRLDLLLDRGAVTRYRQRLGRLQTGLAEAVRRAGGTFACVRAAAPEAMFRRDLLPQRVVQPA